MSDTTEVRAVLVEARDTLSVLLNHVEEQDAYIDSLESENEMLKRVCEDWYMKYEHLAMVNSGHIGVPPVNRGSVSE